MVKLLYCVYRNPGVTDVEFRKGMADHADLWRTLRPEMPSARKYIQNLLLDTPANEAVRQPRNAPPPFHAVSEVWFNNLDMFTNPTPGELAAQQKLGRDDPILDLGNSVMLFAEEHDVF